MNPDRERKGNKAAARVGGFDRGESHDTMEICCSQSETDRMTVSNQIDGIDTYYYDLLWGLKQIKGSTRMCRQPHIHICVVKTGTYVHDDNMCKCNTGACFLRVCVHWLS
jgi:hypothetical protein